MSIMLIGFVVLIVNPVVSKKRFRFDSQCIRIGKVFSTNHLSMISNSHKFKNWEGMGGRRLSAPADIKLKILKFLQ